MPAPASGSGGSAGTLSSYNVTTSPVIGATLASVSVPNADWWHAECLCWNIGTTGVPGTDDLNIGLWSDSVVSGTLVFQRVIPWNFFVISSPPLFYDSRTRLFAFTKIALQSFVAGTSGSMYVATISVTPAIPGTDVD